MADKDANEFWYQLDQHFQFDVEAHPDVLDAYDVIQMPDGIPNLRVRHRRSGTYPDGFVAAVTPMRAALDLLSQQQLAILDRHFGNDGDAVRAAFEDFGQGIHFDDRRPPGHKIHMMDSSGPANPAVGFHRWHAIIRAQILLGLDAERWSTIERCVGLAWAIQSEAQPVQGTQPNRGMAPGRLQTLRDRWMTRTATEIDDAFDSFPFPSDADLPR